MFRTGELDPWPLELDPVEFEEQDDDAYDWSVYTEAMYRADMESWFDDDDQYWLEDQNQWDAIESTYPPFFDFSC